ncbi:TY-Chap domain-containing protein [Terrihabitans sp. B22-R8]|uniref:TY-Chap domain-containing protein n=1 Tax=Terrihabitans sp. B22-R8 TaxID=3425128 RepID=UPI00403C11EE
MAAASPQNDFVDAHRCDIAGRLASIFEVTADRDRFLVLSLLPPEHGYVQCLFQGQHVLCEAESGVWTAKPGEAPSFRVSEAGLVALRRLGFDGDGDEGNYRQRIEADRTPDFEALADLMLKALRDGYGASLNSEVEINAPFAAGEYRPARECLLG